jgi:GcrA cell cycle regulator
MSWTDERVELLKRLWIEGHSASQIANQLGGVTRNAVIGKVHRLGLSGRTTPSRPVKRPPRLARPKPRQVGTIQPAMAAEDTPAPVQQAIVVRPKPVPVVPVSAEPAAARVDKAALLASLPPIVLDNGQTTSILTLRDSMCKWPIGDPADAGFAFCGRKAQCGPYCTEHASVAFQPARKKERSRREAIDYVRRIAG